MRQASWEAFCCDSTLQPANFSLLFLMFFPLCASCAFRSALRYGNVDVGQLGSSTRVRGDDLVIVGVLAAYDIIGGSSSCPIEEATHGSEQPGSPAKGPCVFRVYKSCRIKNERVVLHPSLFVLISAKSRLQTLNGNVE